MLVPPAPSLHPCHQGAACSHAQASGRKSERYVSRGNRPPNSSIPVVEPISQLQTSAPSDAIEETMWRPVHYSAPLAYLCAPPFLVKKASRQKKTARRADGARNASRHETVKTAPKVCLAARNGFCLSMPLGPIRLAIVLFLQDQS